MYKRVLLKLSGEALAGDDKTGIDKEMVESVCQSIRALHGKGVEIGVVIGGGNFWRGRYGKGMIPGTAHQMGMLATIMNSLALQDALEKIGIPTEVQSALEIQGIADQFSERKTRELLKQSKVVIFAGGTGNSFFSTDTAAALRAIQISADCILVAKTVDGVYTADPAVDKNAKKYDRITFDEVLEQDLKVMDAAAIALCREHNIPIHVFAMATTENIIKVAMGDTTIGTIVNN